MKIDEIDEKDFKNNGENEEISMENKEEPAARRKPKINFKSKKLIAVPIILIIAAVFIFIAKQFLKPAQEIIKPNIVFPSKAQQEPLVNKSSKFSFLTDKSSKSINPLVKNLKVGANFVRTNKYPERQKKVSKVKTKPAKENSQVVFKVPAISLESMKSELKFNTEINKLKEQAQIAQLRQQIKTLTNSSTIAGGINQGNSNNVSLVGISKNQAIVKFGKTDVTMSVGSSYYGYTCLMIKNTSVVLEKGNKAINLNLSM